MQKIKTMHMTQILTHAHIMQTNQKKLHSLNPHFMHSIFCKIFPPIRIRNKLIPRYHSMWTYCVQCSRCHPLFLWVKVLITEVRILIFIRYCRVQLLKCHHHQLHRRWASLNIQPMMMFMSMMKMNMSWRSEQ